MRLLILFTAFWLTASSAVISWSEPGRACLYKEPAIGQVVFIGCYDGPQRVLLGGPQTDAAYRPAGGDVYVLDRAEGAETAPLIARPVYLGVVRR